MKTFPSPSPGLCRTAFFLVLLLKSRWATLPVYTVTAEPLQGKAVVSWEYLLFSDGVGFNQAYYGISVFKMFNHQYATGTNHLEWAVGPQLFLGCGDAWGGIFAEDTVQLVQCISGPDSGSLSNSCFPILPEYFYILTWFG